MNKNLKWAIALMLPLAYSCQDDMGKGAILAEGDDVEFEIAPMSRTMYADNQWDATSNQALYWGNYINTQDDKIKIFCYQAARKVAEYKVNLATTSEQGSNVAESISKTGSYGIQWGAEGTAHTFYAFYPAEYAQNSVKGTDGSIVNVMVDNGQSPMAYRAVVGDPANPTTTYTGATSLNQVMTENGVNTNSDTNKDAAHRCTIYGQPDMSNAVMVAQSPRTAAEYGKPVPLDFKVLADVVDMEIGGPVTPNSLGGNASSGYEARNFITIYTVQLRHKNGTPICGNFDLDMSKVNIISGNPSSNSVADAISNITNGTSVVQLELSQVEGNNRYCPRLYARVNKESAPSKDEIDHLRLRAFVIPGQVANLNELEVMISTDCGDYTVDLGSDPMVTGAIHRVQLGYFNNRGKDFEYDKWISQLDPNIYVTELSLPGTWHSTDSRYQDSQYLTLASQYENGIRAFETHASVSYKEDNNQYNTSGVTWSTPTVSSPVYGDTHRSGTGIGQYSGSCSRTVTYTWTRSANNVSITPGYTVTNSAGNDLLTGLKNLGAVIKNGEFAVVEIGSPGSSPITVPTEGNIDEVKTIQKTQTGTWTSPQFSTSYTDTWNDISAPTAAEWESETAKTSYTTISSTTGNSFVLGISWVLQQLAADATSGIYTGEILPETTIADVANHFIVKINTNDPNGDQDTYNGFPKNTPAIFSQWTQGKADAIETNPLQWGQPVLTTGTSAQGLTWNFSELDNINKDGNTVANRITALGKYETLSADIYNKGELGQWLQFSVGGFLNQSQDATNCQDAAKQLNPELLAVLTKASRQACPMGLLYFNYALGSNSTYYGESLIRTIINNNSAFLLRRKGANKAAERTNSSFNNEVRPPLKN